MKILNRRLVVAKFRKYKWHFLLQIAVAILFIYLVLLVFGRMAGHDILTAIGLGALASSTFIVFALPKSQAAQPSRIIGGYIIGISAGIICRYLAPFLVNLDWHISLLHAHQFAAAAAVAFALFFMALLGYEHPPAGGFALGLVLDHWNSSICIIVAGAALLLATIRYVFNYWLMNFL